MHVRYRVGALYNTEEVIIGGGIEGKGLRTRLVGEGMNFLDWTAQKRHKSEIRKHN
jgi:hypothetical protein